MKMRLPLLAAALGAACSAAFATEYGTVVSATPVTAQVPVPQQQCSEQQVLVAPRTSGGGALIGALVGGVVGNSVGGGFGRAAATGLGVVAGSVIGDRAEAANYPPSEMPVRSCQTVTGYESRVVGYDVVYDYHGQRYSTRTTRDPGARIALNVSVAPAAEAQPVPPAYAPAPVYAPVPVAAPAPVYAPYPYYGYGVYGAPALAVMPSLSIGIGYGHRWH